MEDEDVKLNDAINLIVVGAVERCFGPLMATRYKKKLDKMRDEILVEQRKCDLLNREKNDSQTRIDILNEASVVAEDARKDDTGAIWDAFVTASSQKFNVSTRRVRRILRKANML